jgi:hypothetical protein
VKKSVRRSRARGTVGRGLGPSVTPYLRSTFLFVSERPRILVLDLLESFARERDVNVQIQRRKDQQDWVCSVTNGVPVETRGGSAREAIRAALEQAGVEIP